MPDKKIDRGGMRAGRLAPIPPHQKIAGALFACAICVLMVTSLDQRGAPADRRPEAAAEPLISVYLIPLPQTKRRPDLEPRPLVQKWELARPIGARPPQAAAAPLRGKRPAAITLPAPTASPPGVDNEAEEARPVGSPAVASATAPAASTPPLRLDPELLRTAARGSRSALAQMAQAGDRDLDLSASGNRSADARWQRAVGAAGRADCLAADESASLLSALSIAARALSGRCP